MLGVEIEGRRFAVEGLAWMDHEFSTSALGGNALGWDWFGLQFDDGRELMVGQIRLLGGGMVKSVRATAFEEPGRFDGSLFRTPVRGAVSSGGFDAFEVLPGVLQFPFPGYTADLLPYAEGETGSRTLAAFADGMTWLKIWAATPSSGGAATAYGSGAEIITGDAPEARSTDVASATPSTSSR